MICDAECGDHPPKGVHFAVDEDDMTAIDISTKYPPVRNYIGGQFVDPDGNTWLDVTNPADGSVLSRVPLSPSAEVDRAVQAANKAFPAWSSLPIKERVQIFFRYKTLLEENIDELAALITEENGKIDSEARAEILKSCGEPDLANNRGQSPISGDQA